MSKVRCNECGKTGIPMEGETGMICGNCGSRAVTPVKELGRQVAMEKFQSAEASALHWKGKAVRLCGLVRRILEETGAGEGLRTDAARIMAGVED